MNIQHTILAFAREVPTRTSIRQILAFMIIVDQIGKGHEVSVSDIKRIGGKDASGDWVFGQSIGRSYELLMTRVKNPRTKKWSEGLGWVELTQADDDRRRKIFSLTKEGRRMANLLDGFSGRETI